VLVQSLKNQFNDRRFAQATGQAQVFSYHEGIAIREASATRAVRVERFAIRQAPAVVQGQKRITSRDGKVNVAADVRRLKLSNLGPKSVRAS
jgi:hypothetical protein